MRVGWVGVGGVKGGGGGWPRGRGEGGVWGWEGGGRPTPPTHPPTRRPSADSDMMARWSYETNSVDAFARGDRIDRLHHRPHGGLRSLIRLSCQVLCVTGQSQRMGDGMELNARGNKTTADVGFSSDGDWGRPLT